MFSDEEEKKKEEEPYGVMKYNTVIIQVSSVSERHIIRAVHVRLGFVSFCLIKSYSHTPIISYDTPFPFCLTITSNSFLPFSSHVAAACRSTLTFTEYSVLITKCLHVR